ncbi:YidC/Oxa1 family insertase periplasmic-domain containing protein [Botrimarina sp.]|uniref:YidC/Oxa1 family insertase periplasmic-domain containing protein n=1 Tax=Botrimarina sp. TaxID=2795802 RepID=UPI0032EC4735
MSIQQRRPQRRDQQPPDQRMLVFLLLAVTLLMFYQSAFVRPPVAEPGEEPAAEQIAADGEGAAAPAPPDAEAEPAIAAPGNEGIEEEPPAEAQLITLGSVAADSPYRMLLTVNNAGAGVERLSLSSKNYSDLDNRSGYLGQLAPTDADSGGALVNMVGEGSPAAAAGLRVGDVITGLVAGDVDLPIDDARKLLLALDQSRPRDAFELRVQRDGELVALSGRLGRHPLDLIRPEIENVRLHTPDPPMDFESALSFVVRIDSLNGRRASAVGGAEGAAGDPQLDEANRRLAEEAWTVEQRDAEGVTLRLRLADLGLEFAKRFEVVRTPDERLGDNAYPSYHFDLSVEVRNLSGEQQTIAYELAGPNGLPIEGFWYANKIGRGDGSFFGDWGSFGLRDVVVRFAGDRLTQFAAPQVAKGEVPRMGQGQPLAFAGVDAQYFSSFVIPKKERLTDVWLSEVRAVLPTQRIGDSSYADRWQNSSIVLTRESVTLAAAGENGSRLNDGYRVFAGPKLPELLEAYSAAGDPDHSLDGVLYYGWFGWAAKPMLWLLHALHAVVRNYGVAIILLTLCVRMAMFPISRHSAKNMVKMQELKPELDRLAERYKEDMQKRAQAQQELFRKHNYNPASGCLPIFLQLPIFMGLYRALAVDVELRQQPLFSDAIRFCGNLAAPDQFIDWSPITPLWMDNGEGILGFGPYFNLLPLATCALFLLQQKMFMPPPANEQAALQQKMMKYMMLFMGLMFFKVPSGLCIYFIVSSLWGIAERKMLPKPTPVAAPAGAAEKPSPAKNTPSANGAGAKAKHAAKKAKARGKKKR